MASDRITFQNLVDEFSAVTGRSKTFSRQYIKDIFATIQEGLRKDENVNIKGLGIFKLQEVPEREVKNPRTGITSTVATHKRIVFRPEKSLREAVNAKYAKLQPKVIKKPAPAKSVPEKEPEIIVEEKPEIVIEKKPEIKVEPKKEPVVFIDESSLKEKTAPPLPPEKRKMPTFIIEEKKKKSAWRWILPLLLIILIFVLLYVVPSKFDSLKKIHIPKRSLKKEAPSMDFPTPSQETQEVFIEAPKPQTLEIRTAPAAPSAGEKEEKSFIHIVKNGNTLWGISRQYYDRATLWPNIYRKNIESLKTPDLLIIGKELLVPELEGEPYNLSKTDSARIAQGYYLAYRAYKKYDGEKAEAYLKVAQQFSTVIE